MLWDKECRDILCSNINIDYEPLQEALNKYTDKHNLKIIMLLMLAYLFDQLIPLTSLKYRYSEWVDVLKFIPYEGVQTMLFDAIEGMVIKDNKTFKNYKKKNLKVN